MNEIYFSICTDDSILQNFSFIELDNFCNTVKSKLQEEKYIYLTNNNENFDTTNINVYDTYNNENEQIISLNNSNIEDNIFNIFENETVNISI